MWLLFAFSGPVFWAASTHVDKFLVERYFKHAEVAVLLVFTALIGLVMLPFIGGLDPEVLTPGWKDEAAVVCSGLLYMTGMYFYLKALQREEASVVAPFFQAAPLFAYALGLVFLDEQLTARQLFGGGLIVAGGALISVRLQGKHRFRGRLLALMLAAALALAVSSVTFKAIAEDSSFWTTAFWSYVGEALFGVGILALPAMRKEFIALFRRHPGAVLGTNAANELINLGGNLGARYALMLAPLSLVQAISGTTTLFVFGFGVLLTLFLPRFGREDLSAKNLWQKGICAALITAGVALVGGSAQG
ncbi:MAG TPA: DMT family transporter [Gammaproteobacteria bacterium]|jgi:drug/metabolite transporter (DMT)-like permease